MRPEAKLLKMRNDSKQGSRRQRIKRRAKLTGREVRAQHRLEVELAAGFVMEGNNDNHVYAR